MFQGYTPGRKTHTALLPLSRGTELRTRGGQDTYLEVMGPHPGELERGCLQSACPQSHWVCSADAAETPRGQAGKHWKDVGQSLEASRRWTGHMPHGQGAAGESRAPGRVLARPLVHREAKRVLKEAWAGFAYIPQGKPGKEESK